MAEIRKFETGATRDGDKDKLDYEGFLSPLVLEQFAKYMAQNRVMADGSQRASDNWQKGIPLDAYMKSAWRHFFSMWKGHRGGEVSVDDLCGVLFNTMGYLHEKLKADEVERLRLASLATLDASCIQPGQTSSLLARTVGVGWIGRGGLAGVDRGGSSILPSPEEAASTKLRGGYTPSHSLPVTPVPIDGRLYRLSDGDTDFYNARCECWRCREIKAGKATLLPDPSKIPEASPSGYR